MSFIVSAMGCRCGKAACFPLLFRYSQDLALEPGMDLRGCRVSSLSGMVQNHWEVPLSRHLEKLHDEIKTNGLGPESSEAL